MSYAPNVDAAQHLVKDILPRIQTRPIRVVLAGAEPAASVTALASDEVTVTGWVDDIAAEYKRATLFVAPLRLGTGLQNKVLEAMASALPCVLSPHAFAPLGMPAHGMRKSATSRRPLPRASTDFWPILKKPKTWHAWRNRKCNANLRGRPMARRSTESSKTPCPHIDPTFSTLET